MNDRMNIRELVDVINSLYAFSESDNDLFTSRMVRFLISEGVLSEPFGKNRFAYYTMKHVEEIQRYFEYRTQGLSVRQIAEKVKLQPKIFNLTNQIQISISGCISENDIEKLTQEFKNILIMQNDNKGETL